MIIHSIHVRNFRSARDAELTCDDLTALVGANGSGKSTLLQALRLFYESSPDIGVDDFYDRDSSQDLVVSITFRDLSSSANELFGRYVREGRLSVERVFTWDSGKVASRYHGASLQQPDFRPIRTALASRGRARQARTNYDSLRQNELYRDLPAWSNQDEAPGALARWEDDNPDKCRIDRDDGQFFGFQGVGRGYLGRYTRLISIPAVRDAGEDGTEGRGSIFTQLMNLVVRKSLAGNRELAALKEELQQKYGEVLDPEFSPYLSGLSAQMSKTLQTLLSDRSADVDLRWLPIRDIDLPVPQAEIRLIEDGFASTVGRTGHGLQRGFVMTILQHLAAAQSAVPPVSDSEASDDELWRDELPDLVLAVEEPELYQHPGRQRRLARVLLDLASGSIPGVAKRTQVIYSTHSPLFVGIDRVSQIRLFRRTQIGDGRPKVTTVNETDLDTIADRLWRASDQPQQVYTAETLKPRLASVMSPWVNEGFFAEVAVLVEGESDWAAILAAAAVRGIDLDAEGCAVIPCMGKTKLDRPALVFQQLGIPVYLVWDSDRDGRDGPHTNHLLLRIVGAKVEDWPCAVQDTYACLEHRIERVLASELGAHLFGRCLDECQDEYCVPKRDEALKSPIVMRAMLEKASCLGGRCTTLDLIVDKVLNLKSSRV